MSADDQLVKVGGLLAGEAVEAQVVQDEQVRGKEGAEGALHRVVHSGLGHGPKEIVAGYLRLPRPRLAHGRQPAQLVSGGSGPVSGDALRLGRAQSLPLRRQGYLRTVFRDTPVPDAICRYPSPDCQRRMISCISTLVTSRYAIAAPHFRSAAMVADWLPGWVNDPVIPWVNDLVIFVVVLRLGHQLTVQRKYHPMRELTLNQQEQARIQVLNSVLEHHLSIAQAAEIMGISERHTKRLLAAYRRDGPAALAHGNRGRRLHNAVPEAAAAAVVKLAGNHYAGANHTHFTELLREREGIDLSRPTVRRILVKAGLGSPRSRRSQQHRFRRKRMPQEGMLIQVDGSHHAWLEERGPKFVLFLAVDDATGVVAQALFHPSEDTRGYLVLLEGLVRQWGIPLPGTATGMRPSSTTPARGPCFTSPPSSPG